MSSIAFSGDSSANRYVEFEQKRQKVRGLLKKRARKYESDSSGHGSEDSDSMPQKRKKVVQKSSLSDAFRSIMNKKIANEESLLDHFAQNKVYKEKQQYDINGQEVKNLEKKPVVAHAEPVLIKYKKRARDIEEQKVADEKDRKKRAQKEKQRLMGRVIPTKENLEHERELQIIATKGVVQLFNAVAEFQADLTKDALREDKEKRQKASKMIQSVGADKNTGAGNFNSLIEKINSTQRKWKVLEEDEDVDGDQVEEIDAFRGIKIQNE